MLAMEKSKGIHTLWKTFGTRHGKVTLALLFGAGCFLFWFLVHPEMLNYQEQNQLFLSSSDYLQERLKVPGGLADWLSEGLVQFYYVPWLGALLLSVLLATLPLWFCHRHYIVSLVLPLLVICHLGDANTLWSYVVALWLVLAVSRLSCRLPWWADAPLVLLLYWLLGPMTWVYVAIRWLRYGWRHSWLPLLLLTAQVSLYYLLLSQYPFSMVMCGINYYRIPLHFPVWQFLIPIAAVLLWYWNRLETLVNVRLLWISESLLVIGALLLATSAYDKDYCELLRQDMLVRQGKWDEVIRRADCYQVKTAFSSNCVNLALAMRRQLADRMFTYYQSGEDALLQPCVRDNTSDLPTAEAFYYLGMVNSCLRYYSDLQESILNARKSGRCERRIVECLIVNGDYTNARKHIDLLKQSLFYRAWAKEAEGYLDNDARVDGHARWGWMRKQRYKSDFLYTYQQIDKMLGLLFVDCPDNKMALDYFMEQMLLKGDIQGFTQHLSWVMQYGGYADMPIGYRDALSCIQSKGQQPGSAYAGYVKRMMATAKAAADTDERVGK